MAKIGKIVLHAQAQDAIASSWRALARFLPKTLPLPAANLSKTVYPLGKTFTLSQLQADAAQYQQLYSLVVRSLRLCDGRAVQ